MFDRGEYIGNEVDYKYGEDFNSNLRADILNFNAGNETLKPDSIGTNDIKYADINETIKAHRLVSIAKTD